VTAERAIRIGYVGAGTLAQKVHLRNLTALPEFDVVALAEARPSVGRRVQERFAIPRLYASHDELATDPEVEAVVISTHFATQGEIAIAMLNAGKDVLVEKPMAVSVEQARRVVDAERVSGRRLMVAYMRRYDGANVAAKELVDELRASGELGRVKFIRAHNFCGDWLAASTDVPVETSDEPMPPLVTAPPEWLPDHLFDRYVGYLQVLTHNVNLIRWFLDAGEDVEEVAVDLDDDGFSGVVVLAIGGVRTVLETAKHKFHSWDDHTQIFFERGWIKTTSAALLAVNVPSQLELYRFDDSTTRQIAPSTGWTWAYTEELKHFASCLRTGERFRTDAADAVGDAIAFERIYQAYVAREGRLK
jgi:predicted dehydrogenase